MIARGQIRVLVALRHELFDLFLRHVNGDGPVAAVSRPCAALREHARGGHHTIPKIASATIISTKLAPF
jgi:hypothetical protein